MNTATDRLSCSAINVKPIEFDWSQGYGDTWDIVYPNVEDWTVQQCHDWLKDIGADMPDFNPFKADRAALVEALEGASIQTYDNESTDELREAVLVNINDGDIDGIDEWREAVREAMQEDTDRFTPVMNYIYPLPDFSDDPGKAQALLDTEGGAVCIVQVGDNYFLSLTGGGMDLSWDIAGAYILLGYYPPVHFCDLPEFAEKWSPTHQKIADACRESCKIASDWALRTIERLNATEKNMRAYKS